MATANPAQSQAQNLATEIAKMQADLLEKQKQLSHIQQSEVESLVNKFVTEVEKNGFDRVLVKKIVTEKLTRRNKRRK